MGGWGGGRVGSGSVFLRRRRLGGGEMVLVQYDRVRFVMLVGRRGMEERYQ
jgi:hypothetical protein